MSLYFRLAVARKEAFEGMEQIGEYLIRRLIGEGGMGKVYEAEERLSKRRVALKVMHPDLSKSETARRLFLNEMQILARIEHPNVVRSLASFEVEGELVIVLEYLPGHTLRTVLTRRGRFPWPEAVALTIATARGLAAAHDQSPPVIHRDLKPENIMVLDDGGLKVMDFGIAKVVEAINQTNTQSAGTLQYMSPEQIDARTIDHRSDLYCLGLVLYELLTGRPPFTSPSPRQLLNLQCTATPPPLDDALRTGLPAEVEAVLFELLEKAPEDRPYHANHVVERLEALVPAPGTPLPRSPKRTLVSASRDATTTADTELDLRSESARTPPHVTTAEASNAAPSTDAARSVEPAPHPDDRSARREDAAPRAAPIDDARRRAAPRPNDTIALLEQKSAPIDVPTRWAVAIVVALSLLSGLAAYAVRAAREPETIDRDRTGGRDRSRGASGSSAGGR
jgi:serine/threonine-protein kinase